MDIVSIIIPCYNGARFIERAIKSVQRQTSDRWECVIVDDGSTDESLSIVQSIIGTNDKFRVFHTDNHGVAHARNYAIERASGKYILPLDADDKLSDIAVETFLDTWSEHPDASLLVPMIKKHYINGETKIQQRLWRGYEFLKVRCTPNNSSCYKKSDWDRVGGYRDGVMYEDWEFWIRLLYKNDNVINIPKVLVDYIMRPGSRWCHAVKRHESEIKIIRNMNKEIYMEDKVKGEDKVLVVIPYFAKGAQGRELEYAVAGWRKHFKEPHHIVVVGDYNQVVDSGDDITFIPCPRIDKPPLGNYRPHLDHVHKFREVRKRYPNSRGFIYTCDDIYAVRDFTLEDIMKPKVKSLSIAGKIDDKNAWVRDNVRTKSVLRQRGLNTYNWVCHLPVYYEWDKLFAIYDEYHCDTKSYVVEQLYFNTYFSDVEPVVLAPDTDDIQYRLLNSSTSIDKFKESLSNKIWLNNSVKGWQPEMETILQEYYCLQ